MCEDLKISVYDFLSYRDFIREYLKEKKEQNPNYSQRVLLRKMDISSSGFIANVIAGRSNFTIEQATMFTKILGLNTREIRYFNLLLYFAKARNKTEKDGFFQQIISYRKIHYKKPSGEKLNLFNKWYFVVIRELLTFYEFTNDYSALAKKLEPQISEDEAKYAIEELERMKFIRKDERGVYIPSDTTIAVGDEVAEPSVLAFQKEMYNLGKNFLESSLAKDGDLSGLTISVSNEKLARIKEEVESFRNRLIQIAVEEDEPDQVIRCNLQLFKLTKKEEI